MSWYADIDDTYIKARGGQQPPVLFTELGHLEICMRGYVVMPKEEYETLLKRARANDDPAFALLRQNMVRARGFNNSDNSPPYKKPPDRGGPSEEA